VAAVQALTAVPVVLPGQLFPVCKPDLPGLRVRRLLAVLVQQAGQGVQAATAGVVAQQELPALQMVRVRAEVLAVLVTISWGIHLSLGLLLAPAKAG
jgi:hypothetical protein